MSADGHTSSRSQVRRGSASRRVEEWCAGYAPIDGTPDEFMDADGTPRSHWLKFLATLSRLDGDEISRRFGAADRHIRDLGVSYRVYGETHERSWPLSHLPLLIPESEWREIAAGITQRAGLLEQILGDLYGDAKLVSEGRIPASLVAGSSDFLRPMRGVKPANNRWMHIYAADIGRGPDGRWWVLSDRAQAPSGVGYALESRLVLSRAFPNIYRDMNVERLAPFFRDFREGLMKSAQRADPRICMLTSGPYSETYFEQAYLARYLGFLLVEGDDLVVADDRVHVRTIAGLKRADVIWRRVDSEYCDPLELNAASRLGVPGLVDVMRKGNVAIANPPGAGLIETRGLMAFMPALARHLLGEDLSMPNIATWWCGQPKARNHVLERLDSLAIAGACEDYVPGFPNQRNLVGGDLPEDERRRLLGLIADRSGDFVGQEVVRLSTTPVWDNGHLVPRPYVLRVFAAATPSGWCVMPGGFCRISDRADARAVSMGEGVRSSDVWILANQPVEMSTLLQTGDTVHVRRLLGNLPSRAADNLFWLGRYLERVEATLRLIRCLCSRTMDADASAAAGRQSMDKLVRLLASWGAIPAHDVESPLPEIAATAMYSPVQHGSAISLASSAVRAASVIRERLSPDAWRLVRSLDTLLSHPLPHVLSEPEAIDRADAALRIIAALSGLIQENINRVAGWRFLDMGRRAERGINTCRWARLFADQDATADQLDVLLDLIDSQITYRSRYLVGLALAPVRDMVLLDPFNPRSVGFQVDRIDEHLAALPVLMEDGILEAPRRISTRARADLSAEDAGTMATARIEALELQLSQLAQAIAERYFLQSSEARHGERLAEFA